MKPTDLEMMRERAQIILNKGQVNLAVAETTASLIKLHVNQVRFILRDSANIESMENDQADVEFAHGKLLLNGKPTRRKMSAEAKERISIAQQKRWANKKKPVSRKGSSIELWGPESEKKIIEYIASKGQISVPAAARGLQSQFPTRTPGSLSQRIYRFIASKQIKRLTTKKNPGTPVLVGAA